jgi:hypothetical protein
MNTASSLQSFLAQMKQQSSAQRQNKNNNGRRSYFVDPLYSRYMGNTGLGEDGRLQPKNPTAMVNGANGPVMVHEGEDMYQRPNGDMLVRPAAQSIPSSNVTQDKLRSMEKTYDIPGKALGGVIKNVFNKATNPTINKVTDAIDQTARTTRQINDLTPSDLQGTQNTTPSTGGVADLTNPQPSTTVARTVTAPASPANIQAIAPPPNVQTITPPAVKARVAGPVVGPSTPETTPTVTQNITKPSEIAGTTTPQVAPTPNSLTYGQNAMERLNQIMEGGSPALRAVQDRQLQDLKATQGLQQRVAGFEAAQAGLRPEAAAAQQAMGRAVAGSQLAGAQAEMAGNEMQQRETAAKDLAATAPAMQNMEFAQQNQVSNLAEQGYSKDQINKALGTNLSDAQYNSILYSTQRGQNQITAAATAGDWNTVNNLLSQSGLGTIDFSKVQAGEARQVIADIDGMIEGLGENADPQIVAALSSIKGNVLNTAWKSLGIDLQNLTATDSNGNKVNVSDLLKNIETPTDEASVQTVAKMTSQVGDWLNDANGDITLEQLSDSDEWNSLYEKAKNGDTAAATEMGKILGAARTQDLYMSGVSTIKLSDAQKNLLDKYGILREEEKPDVATTTTLIDTLKNKIENNDITGARKVYDQLSDKEKESIGPLEDLISANYPAWAENLISKKKWSEIEKLDIGSDQYNAVVDAMPEANLTSTKTGKNLIAYPEVNSFIKFRDPATGEYVLAKVKNIERGERGTVEAYDLNGKKYTITSNVYGTSINNTRIKNA